MVFGAVQLLPHFILGKSDKKEIKFETGDRPLPQTTNIWVKASDGLVMREKPDISSKQIYLIPNGTQLEATELEGNWYKVSYMGKNGWVNKNWVTTQAPAEKPTKGWNNYADTQNGYTLRYPKEWVVQDYGVNPATDSNSYIGFGPQLPAELDPAVLPPVILRITDQSSTQVKDSYKENSGAVFKKVTISGYAGERVTFNSSSGTQMNAYFVARGGKVYILEETGGYADELTKMVASLNLS